jgi:hypothetical protein
VAGAIILLVLMLTAVPISIFMLGLIISAAFGETQTKDAERRYEGSELVELNR